MRIATGKYSREEIIVALHNPRRNVRFRYELLGRTLQYRRDLNTVYGASVSFDADASIMRTARFSMRDDAVDYLNNRIRPVFGLHMPDDGWAEWPLGVFLLSTPEAESAGKKVNRSIEAYDLNQILRWRSFESRKHFRAGTFYTDAVRNILNDIGVSVANIPHSEQRMQTAIEYSVGAELLETINELLTAINYTPLCPDEFGIYTTRFNREPEISDIAYTYTTKSKSIIMDGARKLDDYFNIPNRFIAYTSDPDRPSLISVYENNDPLSRVSTARRDVVTTTVQVDEIADQASLDKYVLDWAKSETSKADGIQFSSALMPFHGHQNIYQFEHETLGINEVYRESQWSMELVAGGSMTHTAWRL